MFSLKKEKCLLFHIYGISLGCHYIKNVIIGNLLGFKRNKTWQGMMFMCIHF